MEKEPLKPCPFCGSTNLILIDAEEHVRVYAFVECHGCNADGPMSHEGADDARRLWNERV